MSLSDAALAVGYRTDIFERIGSTNDEAMLRARQGDPGRLWIVAREQQQGRGRAGRIWSSPPGNLYASLLLVGPCATAISPQIGFVAGVALQRAVAMVAGLTAPRLALKWPNDLLLDEAKIAGILVEGTMLAGAGPLAAVIGIGVNVRHHPSDTPYRATDLNSAGFNLQPDAVFAALAVTMAETLDEWRGGAGFAAVRAQWVARASGIGEPISVRQPEGERRGIFRDLQARTAPSCWRRAAASSPSRRAMFSSSNDTVPGAGRFVRTAGRRSTLDGAWRRRIGLPSPRRGW